VHWLNADIANTAQPAAVQSIASQSTVLSHYIHHHAMDSALH